MTGISNFCPNNVCILLFLSVRVEAKLTLAVRDIESSSMAANLSQFSDWGKSVGSLKLKSNIKSVLMSRYHSLLSR